MSYSREEQMTFIKDPNCECVQFFKEHKDCLFLTFHRNFKFKGNTIPSNAIITIDDPHPDVLRYIKLKERLKKL